MADVPVADRIGAPTDVAVTEQPSNAATSPNRIRVFHQGCTTGSIPADLVHPRMIFSLRAGKCGYAVTMEVRDSPGKPVTQAVNPEPGTRRGWIWTIVGGFAVDIFGFVLGLQKAGPPCGSPLIPQSQAAEMLDSLRQGTQAAAECYRKIDSASVPVWILMALGIGLVLTGITVRVVSIRRSGDGSPGPTVDPRV